MRKPVQISPGILPRRVSDLHRPDGTSRTCTLQKKRIGTLGTRCTQEQKASRVPNAYRGSIGRKWRSGVDRLACFVCSALQIDAPIDASVRGLIETERRLAC